MNFIQNSKTITTSGRWDVAFHALNIAHGKRAEELKNDIPEDDARDIISNIKLEDLTVLLPLSRRVRDTLNRDNIEAISKEYPHLCLALLEWHLSGTPAIRAKEAILSAQKYANYIDEVIGKISNAPRI